MVDHSSSSDFYEKDLVDLPPRNFRRLRSEGWRVKHLSTVDDGLGQALCLLRLKPPRARFHHRHLWRFCRWKKWGEFDQWIKVLIPQGFEFPSWKVICLLKLKNIPSEKENHLTHPPPFVGFQMWIFQAPEATTARILELLKGRVHWHVDRSLSELSSWFVFWFCGVFICK